MVQDTHAPPVTMEIVTDPVELAKSRARHERFRRNLAWYQRAIEESDALVERVNCDRAVDSLLQFLRQNPRSVAFRINRNSCGNTY